MELTITLYFLLFMIYAFLGWCLEVICKLKDEKKFINRGFLIGPYCPIYGLGAIAITILLYRYKDDPLVLFIMTTVICAILEYVTSYIMEKLFKARWWDYSKRKFNLNGRVCLGTTIPFGLFGLFLTYVSNPFFIELLKTANGEILDIIAISFGVIYIVDCIFSGIIIFSFRKTTSEVNKEGTQDNTEQITKKVRKILSQKTWMHRRLINAYPKLIAIKDRIKEIKDEVKANAVDMKNNINQKANAVKSKVNGIKDSAYQKYKPIAGKIKFYKNNKGEE